MSRDVRPAAKWPQPKSGIAAPSINSGVLVRDAAGGWAFSDDPGAVAEASLVESADGGLAADDSLPAGGSVRRAGNRIIGII